MSNEAKTMADKPILVNRVLVDTCLAQDPRIADVMEAEYEMTNAWRQSGLIEHLFAKENGGGAVVIFNEADVAKVKSLMESLPLYPFFTKVDYLPLDKIY